MHCVSVIYVQVNVCRTKARAFHSAWDYCSGAMCAGAFSCALIFSGFSACGPLCVTLYAGIMLVHFLSAHFRRLGVGVLLGAAFANTADTGYAIDNRWPGRRRGTPDCFPKSICLLSMFIHIMTVLAMRKYVALVHG